MSRFYQTVVTSISNLDFIFPNVGASEEIWFQFSGTNSFSAWLNGTNFVARTGSGTYVASNWIGFPLQYTGPGINNVAGWSYGALRLRVESVIGNLGVALYGQS